ncbi:MAG: hypothetical protein QXT13_08550 [Pyrobaculum sp.]
MPAPLLIPTLFTAANVIGRSLPLVTGAVNALLGLGGILIASRAGIETVTTQDNAVVTRNRMTNRLKNIAQGIKAGAAEAAKEALKDLAKESIKDAITSVPAIILLTDALSYWIFTDFLVKTKYHPRVGVPTRMSFVEGVTHVLNAVTSMMLVDMISNRDIGSDIAENIVESFNEAILGDALKEYVNTVAGVESADDDEIRDIMAEDVVQTPHEIAFLGARSGLDNFSAMAELYTGALEGLNPYFSRAAREIEDNLKRIERGSSLYVKGRLIEKLGEDVADAVYWYMSVTDTLESIVRRTVREMVETEALADDPELVEIVYQTKMKMLENIEEIVDNLANDKMFINYLVDMVISRYDEMMDILTPDDIYYVVTKVLDRVGNEVKEVFDKMSFAYQRLKELRTVKITEQ